MATKSKNIKPPSKNIPDPMRRNFFAGLISWLCMLGLIYAFTCVLLGLAFTAAGFPYALDISYILYRLMNSAEIPYDVALRTVSLICLILLIFVLVFAFRHDRKQFEVNLGLGLSKIWVELKLIVITCTVIFFWNLQNGWLSLLAAVLGIYLLCLDLGMNRSFFQRNIVSDILTAVNANRDKNAYEYLSVKRLYSTVGVVSAIFLAAVVFFSILSYLGSLKILKNENAHFLLGFGIILFAGAGIIGSVSWYTISMRKDLKDLTQIMSQVEKMYAGNLKAINHVPPTSNFYDLAMQMNMIRTGIQKAVDEGTKADKTKVELITNVSHDIKTPLTSIITYVELLRQDKELPPHLRDYVITVSEKANRLSHIVQDVFEVSKAATGNISLSMETLDFGKLLQQVFAEMEETIQKAPFTWRFDLTDALLPIRADGQKLYRVFQNLVRNCTQYALEGSRAYVTLKEHNGMAEFVMRNISRNELEPSAAEYLTGRFVRGDQTRTTEGSGLGLSIAKSFTEACGGNFTLRTDGDLFLVTIQFPLAATHPPYPPQGLPKTPGTPEQNTTPPVLETAVSPDQEAQE